jgi:hypothetical protein
MAQPDSSRDQAPDRRWNETDAPWPVDPDAPHRFGSRLAGRSGQRPIEKPEQDGRTPQDPDGNEELEREEDEDEKPASRRTSREGAERETSAAGRARRDFESEDTSEWVATERFTLDDELDDTWPTVPARYLDD